MSMSPISRSLEPELIKAAQEGDCSVIDRFIESGGSLRTTEVSALLVAVMHHQTAFVEALLAVDPACDRDDWLGSNAFDLALETDQVETVKVFLESTKKLHGDNASSDGRAQPLHAAAGGHACGSMSTILKAGWPVDGTDSRGMTALMTASRRWADTDEGEDRKRLALDTLLSWGAEVNAQDASGKTALHHACIANDVATIYHLVSKGARLDITSAGLTPFFLAISEGSCSAIRVLHELGGCSARTENGETPITFYLKQERVQTPDVPDAPVLATLLALGFQPDEPNQLGEKPLEIAGVRAEDRSIIAAALARRAVKTILARRAKDVLSL